VDREAYVETLLDYYENPRNSGALPGAQIEASGSNPGCGDIVKMYAKLDGEGRLAEVRFDGEGCTISQASASMITELAQGKTIEELEAMGLDELVDVLGLEVVNVRPRCATLGLTVLKSAARDYVARTKLSQRAGPVEP
jgi:nitrogen fixation NifU-like protein